MSDVLEATSRTICAPMFSSGSRSSISLATVTPSLVMIGAPNFFSITALRPLGPRVIFTASARIFTPRRIAWREFSPVTICFAILVFPPEILANSCCCPATAGRRPGGTRPFEILRLGPCRFGSAASLRQDFFLAKDQQLFVFDLDFRAAVLAEEDTVARLDV